MEEAVKAEVLSLANIEPGVEKLTAIAEECRALYIAGTTDVDGYKKVHEARMNLRKLRVAIKYQLEEKRAGAVAFQKECIGLEKKLVAIIEPVEDQLANMEEAIDRAKAREKRMALMPEREEKLKAIDAEYSYDLVLDMDEIDFLRYFNEKYALYLKAKEAAIQAEEERKEAEAVAAKVKAEDEARAEEEKKGAALKAEREAAMPKRRERLQALGTVSFTDDEISPLDDVQFESYYNGRVAEKNRIEAERKAAEAKAVEEAEAKAAKEKANAERKEAEEKVVRERQQKHIDFMAEHSVTDETKDQFHVEFRDDGDVVLYKEVGRYSRK